MYACLEEHSGTVSGMRNFTASQHKDRNTMEIHSIIQSLHLWQVRTPTNSSE